ncbi:MAG TPA: prepilin-type N-terminal cleavage/methylation domain-containing protein, partial [Verrucomicrobiota bacterium]|nr:prepilin-type N-terminal cleavage/methylation domain-containing protein [Verrucomicrobiota bacterium]
MKHLTGKSGGRRGFTLVELLVVIVIIGILASLVVGLSGTASRKMRESRTRAELTAIGTAIESYKAKFGHYPPCNPKDPALNSLYYELTGCLYSPGRKTFRDPMSGVVMNVQTIKEHFGVEGFINTARTETELKKFYEPTSKTVRHISEEHGDDDDG